MPTPLETPPWPPNTLAWRQALAAYWSIAWAAGFAVALLMSVIPSGVELLALACLVFFAVQALLVRRLVSKNYRTFQIAVLRKDGPPSRTLTKRESLHVAARILWPQVACLLVWIAADFLRSVLRHWRIPNLGGIALLLFSFAVSPATIRFAVCTNYSGFPKGAGFRLQSYALRFI